MLAKLEVSLETGVQPTEEQWEIICKLFPARDKNSSYRTFFQEQIVMDTEQFLMVTMDKGFTCRIISTSPHQMIVKLKDRYDHEISEIENFHRGSIIQIHVPNIALMTYNEIYVEEDACTDRIQESLNEGWRIIAVCPPNAQRRPDYILGRYNPHGKNN